MTGNGAKGRIGVIDGPYDFLARRADLGDGETLSMRRGNLEVLLCRRGERVYGFENRCPHQGRPMDGALIRGGQLVCPHHGARFDLETGNGRGGAESLCLKILDVRLTNTDVEIRDRPI